MKRNIVLGLVIVLMSLFASGVWAAGPYLISDPLTQPFAYYKLTGPSWVPTSVPPQADGSLKLDVSAAVVNVKNDLTVQTCINDVWQGVVCSTPPTPFSFTRPGVGTITAPLPLNLRLSN